MRKLGNIILIAFAIIFIVPLGIVIFALLSPVLLLKYIKDRVILHVFCLKERGNFFLVCARRRGWNEFLINNLIPSIPSNVKIVWNSRRNYRMRRKGFMRYLDMSGITNIARPFVVFVGRHKLIAHSINNTFVKLKTFPAKSENVRTDCRVLFDAETARYRQSKGRNSLTKNRTAAIFKTVKIRFFQAFFTFMLTKT